MEEIRSQLEAIEPPEAGVRLERHLVIGIETEEILRIAVKKKSDLIVMGTHGRTGFSRLLMGSVAEHVLRKAPCAVLTIRAAAQSG
jgi:nucleotide-binding universal stress UspA family protein